MQIIFETHSTSLDNEAGLASGRFDVDLSVRGEQEAERLGLRRRGDGVEVVYVSDLRRSWRTGEIAFRGTEIRVVRDSRLGECDYGHMTRHPVAAVAAVRDRFVTVPFPGGESYAEATARVAAWLAEVRTGGFHKVLVIGHRATQYALEHLLRGVPLVAAVRQPLSWQPGWVYEASS
jgi:broad specificity phosphatase PhoE